MKKEATISECGKYRYQLHRIWDKEKEKVLFIMLNPSTADGNNDDLTTIRCINYAKKWGFGGLMIGNIYPYRTKRPRYLRQWMKTCFKEDYPTIHKENISNVQSMVNECKLVVCAWGCNHPGIPEWLGMLNNLHYLELCSDGITPKHPLGNLSKDLIPKQITN